MMKNFFDTFRPRSKSDVSGMTKPVKLPDLARDHSNNESFEFVTVDQQLVSLKSPLDPLSPMSQILEGQIMQGRSGAVTEKASIASRSKHKSMGLVGYDNFVTKFRERSNSDSRTKPHKPLFTQVNVIKSQPVYLSVC